MSLTLKRLTWASIVPSAERTDGDFLNNDEQDRLRLSCGTKKYFVVENVVVHAHVFHLRTLGCGRNRRESAGLNQQQASFRQTRRAGEGDKAGGR